MLYFLEITVSTKIEYSEEKYHQHPPPCKMRKTTRPDSSQSFWLKEQQVQSPKMWVCLAYLRNSKEVGVAEVQRVQGRTVKSEFREVARGYVMWGHSESCRPCKDLYFILRVMRNHCRILRRK